MTKQKIGVIAGSVLGGIVLLGGAFWLGSSNVLKKDSLKDSSASFYESTGPSQNSIPLGGEQASTAEPSGLSVSGSSGASNLGQLGGSGGQNPSGGSANGSQGTHGSSSSSSAINPATFGEYEKYKGEAHALFGEIKAGTGDELTANKKAAVFYKGWLTNGKLFDESKPGADGKMQPFIFTLGAHQVIPGWEEALAGMKVGGSRLVIVPPAVGYGAQGQGSVPPNAVMVFQVQLVAVQ